MLFFNELLFLGFKKNSAQGLQNSSFSRDSRACFFHLEPLFTCELMRSLGVKEQRMKKCRGSIARNPAFIFTLAKLHSGSRIGYRSFRSGLCCWRRSFHCGTATVSATFYDGTLDDLSATARAAARNRGAATRNRCATAVATLGFATTSLDAAVVASLA